MSPRAALTSALLTTLATPATWPMALAVFLLRGGLLVIVLPIVVLPSPVGLGNVLAPTLTSVVFRGVTGEVALLVGLIVVALIGWIVAGGLLAAAIEAEGVRAVVRSEEASGERPGDVHPATGSARRIAVRILVARLAAHVPTGFVLVVGLARLVTLAYRELTSPFDVATPIALRVIRGAPEVVGAILIAWTVGEIGGALAARRIAHGGTGVARALRDAAVDAVRHPVAVLVEFWVPTCALVVVAVPAALAASAMWRVVRIALRSPGEAAAATLAVVLFVALWAIGLLLVAVTVAWRSAVWSVAHGRVEQRQTLATGGEPG